MFKTGVLIIDFYVTESPGEMPQVWKRKKKLFVRNVNFSGLFVLWSIAVILFSNIPSR